MEAAATIHNIHQQSFAKTLQKMMESIENPISFFEITPSKFEGGMVSTKYEVKTFWARVLGVFTKSIRTKSLFPKHWHGPQMIAVIH